MHHISQQLHRFDPLTFFLEPPERRSGELRIAGYNLGTQFRDSADWPQYQWKNRVKPMFEFIKQDQPDILALYEFNLIQAKDLRDTFKDQYHLLGFSSELGETIEKVDEMLKQAISDRANGKEVKDPYYGEFVGFLINGTKFEIDSVICHELPKGVRHKRLLVEVNLTHIASKTHMSVFSSHFDHLSLDSRMKSGEKEIEIIAKKVKEGVPCISFGDRNWFPDASGQECYETYIKSGLLDDIRDNEEGHFGPMGTFPGHLSLPEKFAPKISKDEHGCDVIEASTLDVGFVTKNFKRVNSYTSYVSFDAEGHLLPNSKPGNLREKNFASDHGYLGASIRFLTE